MSTSPVHPLARCARCEAPWHTGHALECPLREGVVSRAPAPITVQPIRCSSCGSACLDFAQRMGERRCILCVQDEAFDRGRRHEADQQSGRGSVLDDALTGAVLAARCYGFEDDASRLESWLERELAELHRRRAAETHLAQWEARRVDIERIAYVADAFCGGSENRAAARRIIDHLVATRATQGFTHTTQPRPASQGEASCSESAEAEAAPTGQLSRSAQATPADFGEGEVHDSQ